MPVQNYTINTPDATAGQLYGLQQTRADIQTGIIETEDGINFGTAVSHGAGHRGYVVGSTAAHVAGITVRQIDREASKRPSDGTVVFRKGEAAPILSDGRIMVKVKDSGEMKAGALMFVNAKGELALATADGFVKTSNVALVLNGTVVAGTIIPVVITNADRA